MRSSIESLRALVICRTPCLVAQAYGPSTVPQRYPFAAKSLTGIFSEYPIPGKSSAKELHLKLKPIKETANIPSFIILSSMSWGSLEILFCSTGESANLKNGKTAAHQTLGILHVKAFSQGGAYR